MTEPGTPILLMRDRRRDLIPIDKVRVINSRTGDESQFARNVQVIRVMGRLSAGREYL